MTATAPDQVDVVDIFAGPGGWDEGLQAVWPGARCAGVELDADACRTAHAAGHPRIRADVAALDPGILFGGARGLIASPPCQAWSAAGRRLGERDRAACHQLADRMAAGDDNTRRRLGLVGSQVPAGVPAGPVGAGPAS